MELADSNVIAALVPTNERLSGDSRPDMDNPQHRIPSAFRSPAAVRVASVIFVKAADTNAYPGLGTRVMAG